MFLISVETKGTCLLNKKWIIVAKKIVIYKYIHTNWKLTATEYKFNISKFILIIYVGRFLNQVSKYLIAIK